MSDDFGLPEGWPKSETSDEEWQKWLTEQDSQNLKNEPHIDGPK